MGDKVLLLLLKCNYVVKHCVFIEVFLLLQTTKSKSVVRYMTTDVLSVVFWPLSIIIAPSILFEYTAYVRSAYCGVSVRRLKAQLSYAFLMANADDSVIFAPPFSDSLLSASFIWKCYFFLKTAYFWCLFVFSRRWQQSEMFLRWCDAEIALRAVWSDTSETKVALTHLVPALCWFISFLFHCACSVDRRPVRLASDGLWIFLLCLPKVNFFQLLRFVFIPSPL